MPENYRVSEAEFIDPVLPEENEVVVPGKCLTKLQASVQPLNQEGTNGIALCLSSYLLEGNLQTGTKTYL